MVFGLKVHYFEAFVICNIFICFIFSYFLKRMREALYAMDVGLVLICLEWLLGKRVVVDLALWLGMSMLGVC